MKVKVDITSISVYDLEGTIQSAIDTIKDVENSGFAKGLLRV